MMRPRAAGWAPFGHAIAEAEVRGFKGEGNPKRKGPECSKTTQGPTNHCYMKWTAIMSKANQLVNN